MTVFARITTASLLALSSAMLSPAAFAQSLDEGRVKELVLEAIRENPDIIREAISILQTQEAEEQAAQAALALQQSRDALENDPNAPVLGNPDGTVTVVEFFDYNCGYCRRVFGNVKELVDGDKDVRLVMREWPILGEESVFAARASLASRNQGKYEAFHNALMANQGRATEASVMSIAKQVGLDVDQLEIDMNSAEIDAHIQASHELTQALGLNGTPAFVFGDQVVPGAIELDQMKQLVEGIRG